MHITEYGVEYQSPEGSKFYSLPKQSKEHAEYEAGFWIASGWKVRIVTRQVTYGPWHAPRETT